MAIASFSAESGRRTSTDFTGAVRSVCFPWRVLNAQEHSSDNTTLPRKRLRGEIRRPPRQRRLTAILLVTPLVIIAAAQASQQNAPGQNPPRLSTPPSISGTFRENHVLTATEGTWSGPDQSHSFQWARCDGTGSACAPITANDSQYLLAAADVGHTLRVVVTATNKNGSTVTTSEPTPQIAPALSTKSVTTTTATATTTTTTPATATTTTTTATTTTTTIPSLGVSGRWYSATSAWNTPIPPNPALSPDNSAQISWMVQNASNVFGPTLNSVPSIFIATNATPWVTVQVNYPVCNARQIEAPIPSGALPGAGAHGQDFEPSMVVARADTGEEWDFWGLTPPGAPPSNPYGLNCSATGNWATLSSAYNSPGWTGSGIGPPATRGSGTLAGAGTIRVRDAQTPAGGTWDHAIAVAYPHTRNSAVWPAIWSDGRYTDAASIPMGSRIQLDPNFDVENSGLPEWQKQMCRTLQRYGMIVVETGNAMINEGLASVRAAGFTWPWEPGWARLPASVLSRMRVLR